MSAGFVIALLGAESTGKTTLARQLHDALATPRRRVTVVGEYLREFCNAHGRTPLRHEQRGIADEQTRRIGAAAQTHDLVIADTTALMTAVYSDHVFGDTTLYATALAAHARCELTLLTALDLPWQPDGLQRDGPQVREPVDARLRAALDSAGLAYSVVGGLGPMRCQAAHACVQRALKPPAAASARWQWHCERHSLLPRPP
ncbi:MAG: ATP-binding protein [Burkholderiaceae bacterium]